MQIKNQSESEKWWFWPSHPKLLVSRTLTVTKWSFFSFTTTMDHSRSIIRLYQKWSHFFKISPRNTRYKVKCFLAVTFLEILPNCIFLKASAPNFSHIYISARTDNFRVILSYSWRTLVLFPVNIFHRLKFTPSISVDLNFSSLPSRRKLLLRPDKWCSISLRGCHRRFIGL